MKAWVVVESMFGNSREVADEIVEGLRGRMPVEIYPVGQAPLTLPEDLSLLVVGGPTHAFGMSREGTRQGAEKRGASTQTEIGLRDWLEMVTDVRPGLPAAAFDTRIPKAFVPGSAARAASRRLRNLGCLVIAPPASFYVEGVEGPLRPGERSRAKLHGVTIAMAYEHAAGHTGAGSATAGSGSS